MKISERIKSLFRRQPPPTAEELAARAEAESVGDRAREDDAVLGAQLDAQLSARDVLPPPPF